MLDSGGGSKGLPRDVGMAVKLGGNNPEPVPYNYSADGNTLVLKLKQQFGLGGTAARANGGAVVGGGRQGFMDLTSGNGHLHHGESAADHHEQHEHPGFMDLKEESMSSIRVDDVVKIALKFNHQVFEQEKEVRRCLLKLHAAAGGVGGNTNSYEEHQVALPRDSAVSAASSLAALPRDSAISAASSLAALPRDSAASHGRVSAKEVFFPSHTNMFAETAHLGNKFGGAQQQPWNKQLLSIFTDKKSDEILDAVEKQVAAKPQLMRDILEGKISHHPLLLMDVKPFQMAGTSEVITPRPITPTFGCAKETHPHTVGLWLRGVWSRRLLVVCRGGVSWEGGCRRPYYSSVASRYRALSCSPKRVSEWFPETASHLADVA